MHNLFIERESFVKYFYLPLLLLLALSLTSCDIFKSDGRGEEDNEQEEEEEQVEEPGEEPADDTVWLKGNLHAHSYWTDAVDYPDMILNWYKEQGYDFAVVSGHNDIHEGERSIEISNEEDEYYLQRYLDQFGEDWVEEEDSTVTLKTYNEYSNKLTTDDFLAIRAQEIDYRDSNNPDYNPNRLIHLNAINIQEYVEPSEGGTTPAIIQETLDKIEDQANQHNVPMLATINHPNIREAISAEDLMQVDGARFFEVYSGHPNATNEGHGSLASTEELWDEVLTHYVQNGKELLYGVAADDSHEYNFDNGVSSDSNLPGRGWIQVKTEDLTPQGVVNAMNEGEFYASTGVELTDVTFEDGTLSVSVNEEEGVNYRIQFIGTNQNNPNEVGTLLTEEINGTEGSYTLTENDLYVRAKVISDKPKENASSSDEFEVAYVQPVTQ